MTMKKIFCRLISNRNLYYLLFVSQDSTNVGIILCNHLCNRNELSIQTALQNKVLGGPDEYSFSSALCYGPDGTKQLRDLRRKK